MTSDSRRRTDAAVRPDPDGRVSAAAGGQRRWRTQRRRRLLGRRQLRTLARLRPKLALAALALPPALVLLVDAAMRGSRLLDFRGKYLLSYGASLLESGLLWGLLLASASARRGLFRWASAGLFALLSTLSIGGQIYFHGQYDTYLNLDATLFGTSLTSSLLGQVSADSSHFFASFAPVLLVALAVVWLGRRLIRTRRRLARVLHWLVVPMTAAAFVIPCSYRSVQGSTPDVIYFHAIGGLAKQLAGERSPSQIRPTRRTPPVLPTLAGRPARPRNVVMILLEGVRADVGCSAAAASCPTMPRVHRACPERLDLSQMRADTTTTASELAVMWSGLAATATREALHTAPLLFDYAHAAGWDTAYWTSHHMLFANSRLYVQDLPTRFRCGATQLDPLADIDLGADDTLLTARVARELPMLREPFFAVVHYGNTHMPYWIDEDDAPFQPQKISRAPDDNELFRNRYRDSVYRQDKTIAELIRIIRRSAGGPRTIVVLTSDHGEAFREHGQLGHTGSVFDVELRVPAWFDAPAGTLSDEERRALRSYADARVFHSDLTPTLLDLFGLWEEPALAVHRQAMVGWSLLRPQRPERTVALTNCTGVWGCAFQNWGLMRGRHKVHAREWDARWLCYDVEVDPDELAPLATERCGDLVEQAERIYGGLPGRL